MKTYQKNNLKNIAFPVGGIGAGSIGISGNGNLVDPEFMNRPNRETLFGYSHFAVKAENEREVVDWRVLCGDNTKDYTGVANNSFGHGAQAPTAGLPHFQDVTFSGQFPFAKVNYTDSRFPGRVQLEAFNPLIPSNEKDSSLPVAFFTVKVKNTTNQKLKFTVAFSITNPFQTHGLHLLSQNADSTMITLHSGEENPEEAGYGNVTLAVPAGGGISYQQNWFRGEWRDIFTVFVNDFSSFGPLKNRVYGLSERKYADTATICVVKEVDPGKTEQFPFLLTWFVPHIVPTSEVEDAGILKNYYSTLFQNSKEVCSYCLKNGKKLLQDTRRFAKALYDSNLPAVVLDAIQGNLAILKSTTCLRLENGAFWAWEGVSRQSGFCFGTCQHVWNYVYTLPFLFPKLEKGVRTYEYDYNVTESGMMRFRTKPNFDGKGTERACVDGQMGSVMQAYRDWKISGDTQWLRQYWPKIKKALEYAWSPDNQDRWDPERKGVITGRQHHTLDTELFGMNAWLTGFYHGALLAAHEMAKAVGDQDADSYRQLFIQGRDLLDTATFNGEFYTQQIDVQDRSVLRGYPEKDMERYWNPETEQVNYQFQGGCEIDQVLADWHGNLIGLPPIFDPEHRKKALESVYRYNFKSMRDNINSWRVFACDGEKGVLICTWPNGDSPWIPLRYQTECMTGFEYAAACNMLQCGMEKEALEIVQAVRDRYDGNKRNPWAEQEAGASYSRAMASFAFLLTYSGFQYHMAEGMIGFTPIRNGKYFWSVDGAWGTVDCQKDKVEVVLLYGQLSLKKFVTSLSHVSAVTVNGREVDFRVSEDSGTVLLDVELNADRKNCNRIVFQ